VLEKRTYRVCAVLRRETLNSTMGERGKKARRGSWQKVKKKGIMKA
jgi:hypothetical protein